MGSEHLIQLLSNFWIVKYDHELFSGMPFVENLSQSSGGFSSHYQHVFETLCVVLCVMFFTAATILPLDMCLCVGWRNIQ
jgi:hypothetical protein